jgi:protein-disulfide isomerase
MAAQAALAAHKQGKFWEFHSKLMKNVKTMSEAKIEEIAEGLNLDMVQYDKDKYSATIQSIVREDIINGRSAGVRGTPSLYINGKRVEDRSFASMVKMINDELLKLKKE